MGLDFVVTEARKILKEFPLCDSCLGRLYVRSLGLTSGRLLGKRIRSLLSAEEPMKCYICRNLCSSLDSYAHSLQQYCHDLEFSSFVIGSILKPSVLDRDDQIRSRFQLQGVESIKSSITKRLSQRFGKLTGATIDHIDPHLAITINFKNDSFDVRTKPIFVYGRYTKNLRNIPQRSPTCKNCNGKGCTICAHHGISSFDSVEGQIATFLYEKFQSKMIKFSWVGGEDKASLVLGDGRPFFAKILNPKKRTVRFGRTKTLDGIDLRCLKIIKKFPTAPVRFKSQIEILVDTKEEIVLDDLKPLETIPASTINIYHGPEKINKKRIYHLEYQLISPRRFMMTITADGGLPIKGFVESDNIYPNISDLLDFDCACYRFDFLQVNPES